MAFKGLCTNLKMGSEVNPIIYKKRKQKWEKEEKEKESLPCRRRKEGDAKRKRDKKCETNEKREREREREREGVMKNVEGVFEWEGKVKNIWMNVDCRL